MLWLSLLLSQYGTYGRGGQYPGGYGTGQYPQSNPGTPGTPGSAFGGQPNYPGPDAYRGPDGQAYVGNTGPQDGNFGSQDGNYGPGGPGMKHTTMNIVMNMNGPPPDGTDGQVIKERS